MERGGSILINNDIFFIPLRSAWPQEPNVVNLSILGGYKHLSRIFDFFNVFFQTWFNSRYHDIFSRSLLTVRSVIYFFVTYDYKSLGHPYGYQCRLNYYLQHI